jgi:hypothetical protein
MIRYSQIFRGLIFAFALALAASPSLAQLAASPKGQDHKGGPKMEKDKPRKNEMWVKLTNASLGGWGKDGGDFKYWWKHNLAREAMLKKSWASVKIWYNNNEVIEKISEEIRLDAGNGLIKIPPKGDYYPVKYEIKIYADYMLYDKPHSMSDMKYGNLPYKGGKDEPIMK